MCVCVNVCLTCRGKQSVAITRKLAQQQLIEDAVREVDVFQQDQSDPSTTAAKGDTTGAKLKVEVHSDPRHLRGVCCPFADE